MVTIERKKLEQVLEALESGVDTQIGLVAWTEYDSCLISDAITDIKEALAQPAQKSLKEMTEADFDAVHDIGQPAQEMVATMTVEDGRISFAAKILPDGTYDLYTAPPAAQPAQDAEPDELAIAYMSGLHEGKKKRPWVSLTAQEAANCWTTSATQTWKNFEAKLKEKNV